MNLYSLSRDCVSASSGRRLPSAKEFRYCAFPREGVVGWRFPLFVFQVWIKSSRQQNPGALVTGSLYRVMKRGGPVFVLHIHQNFSDDIFQDQALVGASCYVGCSSPVRVAFCQRELACVQQFPERDKVSAFYSLVEQIFVMFS